MLAVPLVFTSFINPKNVMAAELEFSNTFNYNCLATGDSPLGDIEEELPLSINLVTTAPESVEPGESITIKSYSELTFREEVIDGLKEKTVSKVEGTIDKLDIIENKTNKSNAADPAIVIPVTDLPDSGGLDIRLPASGVIETELTAGDDGNLTVEIGDIGAVLTGHAFLGIKVDLNVSCELQDGEDSTIVQYPIESGEDPGNGNGEDPGDGDNGEDPEDPAEAALNAVNNADTPEAMWAALENEALGVNLQAVRNYNTYRKTKIAQWMIDNRPEEGYTVGFADSKDEDYDTSVQKQVNQANFNLFLNPGRPKDPVEPAFNAVNNADTIEAMQAALENEDLGLNLDKYNNMFSFERTAVAALLLENRPDTTEGYPLPTNIQEALDQAVTEVLGGGTWFNGEGEPQAELGREGDLYLDTTTSDIYEKTSDGWQLVGNLKGEDGQDGEDGKDGEDGQDGKDGADGQDGKDGKDCDCDESSNGTNGNDSNKGKGGNDVKSSGTGGQLPKTATTHPFLMMIGSLMAIAGGAVVYIRRRVLN